MGAPGGAGVVERVLWLGRFWAGLEKCMFHVKHRCSEGESKKVNWEGSMFHVKRWCFDGRLRERVGRKYVSRETSMF